MFTRIRVLERSYGYTSYDQAYPAQILLGVSRINRVYFSELSLITLLITVS